MVICGLFYVVNTSLTHLVGDYLYTQKLREEERAAQNLAVDVSSALSELRAGEMLSLAQETARAMDGRVLVVDPYGAVLTDTARLRIKESDRGQAMAQELAKLGVSVEVGENTISVSPQRLHAPTEKLCGHNDHRIVMSLAILLTQVGGVIDDAQSVSKSMPQFWDLLQSLGIKEKQVDL